MRRASAVLVIAALAALALAACGGGGDETTTSVVSTATTDTSAAGGGGATGGGSTVDISTPPGSELAFTQKTADAKAGSVTIDFDNVQSLEHDVAVEDSSGKTLGQTDLVSSSTASTTVELQSGSYTFFCTVPGHREAGMEGTLTVK
jgi:plastocyanin